MMKGTGSKARYTPLEDTAINLLAKVYFNGGISGDDAFRVVVAVCHEAQRREIDFALSDTALSFYENMRREALAIRRSGERKRQLGTKTGVDTNNENGVDTNGKNNIDTNGENGVDINNENRVDINGKNGLISDVSRSRSKRRSKWGKEKRSGREEKARHSPRTPPPPKTELTESEIRESAEQIGIPKTYIPEFMRQMAEKGWGYVKRNGVFVQVTRKNHKAVLRAFYEADRRKEETKPQGIMPEGVILNDDDYDLSAFGAEAKNGGEKYDFGELSEMAGG